MEYKVKEQKVQAQSQRSKAVPLVLFLLCFFFFSVHLFLLLLNADSHLSEKFLSTIYLIVVWREDQALAIGFSSALKVHRF